MDGQLTSFSETAIGGPMRCDWQSRKSAVESITTYYEDAVGKGHEPCATWFVRNDVY